MSLTRRLLKELELNDEAIERIIAAHAATVDALRTERDEALAASAAHTQAVSERDALRIEADARSAEASMLREELSGLKRLSTAEDALRRGGAMPQAAALLARACTAAPGQWDGASLLDEAAFVEEARRQYGDFFLQLQPLPTDCVEPPVNPGGALTRDDVRQMSASDINRNWSEVRSALRRN